MIRAKTFKIEGIVQSVGFRPFIYRLAKEHNLKGEVLNEGAYVHIIIEGEEENIKNFSDDISFKAPPISRITKISEVNVEVKNFKEFAILKSSAQGNSKTSVSISPDIAICEDCLAEMMNKKDRRFEFPFINCTNCGPRYTIIENIPYDRPYTSMKHFKMCEKCLEEYKNPENRRFHAEPNSCHVCGPKLTLLDKNKNIIETNEPIEKTVQLLKQGYITAVKGIGGFHLAADAENEETAALLRERKKRKDKPFAVMSYDIKKIEKYAYINDSEEKIINSFQRPALLLEKKIPNILSELISPKNKYIGVMLPYAPLHYLLLKDFTALIMTSGNKSGAPIVTDNEKAFKELGNIADYFLIHNRDIYIGCDDSVVKTAGSKTVFIRRSRGYVPSPVFLKKEYKNDILACGGELKNTICFIKENNAFLSQHIGDVENLASFDFFEKTVNHLKHMLSAEPKAVAFDMHPEYLSSKYAMKLENIEKIPVQHHHAHIVSCMAENMIDEPVIGVSLDGAGYGTDGAVWGGEIITAYPHKFERAAHLSYLPMPGGAAAVKEPWRMAVSSLYKTFGEEFLNLDIPFLKNKNKKDIELILEMISKNINSPNTSSMGRFFDAAAAIIGIRDKISFEGQAAMELEMLAEYETEDTYEYERIDREICEISIEPIIKGIISDLKKHADISHISAKFHSTVIKAFSETAEKIREKSGINIAALSGGVFQNSLLLSGFSKALKSKDFKVITHNLTPSNDGGLSLGQAVIAAEILKNKN